LKINDIGEIDHIIVMPCLQRRALDLIGRARGAGTLQSQMASDLSMTAGSFFFVVKVLNSWPPKPHRQCLHA